MKENIKIYFSCAAIKDWPYFDGRLGILYLTQRMKKRRKKETHSK